MSTARESLQRLGHGHGHGHGRWRWAGIAALALTAAGFLGTRLVFAPVPWPDGSAFYLPALDLVNWPSAWRMHAQAAFVPSYETVNFNLMPGLPLLLGVFARSGLLAIVNPQWLIRAISLVALLAWAALLWRWTVEALSAAGARIESRARWFATAVALAGLWDPVLRWGTLVVRTETWIGLCWLWIVREAHRRELARDDVAGWNRAAWRIAAGLAVAAYFHFEAVYLVPATIVALGCGPGWFRRLVGIGWRTTVLLSPWLLYVLLHFGVFLEQMEIQFFRLAHGNHWMQSAYMIFHSLFVDHGSPAGWPKFFNLGKGVLWLAVLALPALSLAALMSRSRSPRRALLASTVAFASFFWLWATKAEVWFITLCHLAIWPGIAAAMVWASGVCDRKLSVALGGIAAAYAAISLAASVAQERAISNDYGWPRYQAWVDCLEKALGPQAAKPNLRLWQPHVPDVLVELSRRHPGWDLTRALDFEARRPLAIEAARGMDAILFTFNFNTPADSAPDYFGELRPRDRELLSKGMDIPFGPWALEEPLGTASARWSASACETGPYWAVVLVRN